MKRVMPSSAWWYLVPILSRHAELRDDLRLAIVTWIERTYHRRRRQTRLGRLTPIEFETIIKPVDDQAA